MTIKVDGEEGEHLEQQTEEAEKKPQPHDDDDIDPESKMIIEAFDPVLVTCHMDSFIRFWTPQVKN